MSDAFGIRASVVECGAQHRFGFRAKDVGSPEGSFRAETFRPLDPKRRAAAHSKSFATS